MSFDDIRKFGEQKSTLLAGVCCFLFAVLSLLEKWLEPVISRDGVLYLQMAEVWQREGSYQAMLGFFPDADKIPALPLFLIKCLADCGFSPEIAGVGISMVSGMTLPLLVYLMAQKVQSDKRVSLAAGFLMAVNPSMIELACEVQRDMLYIGLCGWAIFFGLKGLLQKKIWPWIPAGILGALSALTRYETFELIPILIVTFLIFGLKKDMAWKKICQQGAILATALIITGIGMIFLMGIQDFVINSYTKYFRGRMILLERKISPMEKK